MNTKSGRIAESSWKPILGDTGDAIDGGVNDDDFNNGIDSAVQRNKKRKIGQQNNDMPIGVEGIVNDSSITIQSVVTTEAEIGALTAAASTTGSTEATLTATVGTPLCDPVNHLHHHHQHDQHYHHHHLHDDHFHHHDAEGLHEEIEGVVVSTLANAHTFQATDFNGYGVDEDDEATKKLPWKERNELSWQNKFKQLQLFKEREGHCKVPKKWSQNVKLGEWVNKQRNDVGPEKMKEKHPEHYHQLDSIGFWDVKSKKDSENEQWMAKLEELKVCLFVRVCVRVSFCCTFLLEPVFN
jgi:hypothetical protein